MTESTTKVFGVDLEQVVNSQNNIDGHSKTIPQVVVNAIEWLENRNSLTEEGLFRIPGHGPTIQDLKKQYNEGKGDLSKLANSDMHTVAGLLKLYLRELPEPLLIWRYYSTFIKVIKNPEKLQRMLHLRMLIYGLPKVNRDLVLYLMTFLNKVSTFSSTNKMTSANLAMVFAPNLLRHQKESLNQIMEDSNHVTSILKHLIEEISYISKATHYLSTSVSDIPMALIPSNPVSSVESDLGNVLYARALYPYQTNGQWHLPFKKEDQITLLDIKTEEGWMKGELNGRVGYFPASYVEIVAAPLPTEPITLIPIPDIDQTIITPDVTITTTTTTTTLQTTTTTTTTTTTIQKNNSATSTTSSIQSLSTLSDSPIKIDSVPKKNSNGQLRPPPPPRTGVAGSPIIATSTSGEAVPSPSTVAINKLNGSSSSLVNSPDITKIMSTKLSVSSSIPPPTLSPPPTLVTPGSTALSPNALAQSSPAVNLTSSNQSTASSGSSKSLSQSSSPDLQKVMTTTPKLSFSSNIPPSLSLPPFLPSKSLASLGSSVNSATSSPMGTPPGSAILNTSSKSNSFLEFALSSTPPPPLSLPLDLPPPPISTPVKSPSTIDLTNLPPPPFSPCSPEPNPLKQHKEMTPPPTDDLPPPPPLVFSQTSSSTTTEDDHNPPTYEDDDDDSSSESSSFLGGQTSAPAAIPVPPPLPPKRLDRSLSYSFKRNEKMAEEAKKRKERAEEMLSTERTYVKQLTCIMENFIDPVKKNTKFALSDDLLNTFSCLEVILNAHRANILKALEERMTCWDQKPQLGDIFCNNTSFIKLYKHYVNNYDRSIVSLKQCKEKIPEFKALVASLDYTEKFSGLNVESFLILPVQRIPRYVLLLQDLLKYTSNEHQDFDQLCEALGTIKDFAETINFKKSEEDNNSKIQQVQDSIKNLPAHALERRKKLLAEGPILLKKEKYYVFLFNDALILTKPGKEKKKFKTLVNLQTASINTTDEANVIKLISQEGTFKFTPDSAKDREHWTKVFKDAIELARQELLHSAFGDSPLSNEGSKGFNRIQDEKNAQKKQRLAEELCTSEQEYINSLTYIQNVFLSPIRKSLDTPNPLVSYSEGLDICSNFETLLGCHITFYDILKERLTQWEDKPLLSDIFIEKGGFLKLYNYYVQHHYGSLQTIESCIEKYPLFAIHLRNIESTEKVELKHLLAEPLRRIPRYYLILQEILQYTRPKQDDHENLAKVVSQLKEQNDKFNATSILALSSSGDTPRSPHKSKTIRVKPPKGLKDTNKSLNTSGFFSV